MPFFNNTNTGIGFTTVNDVKDAIVIDLTSGQAVGSDAFVVIDQDSSTVILEALGSDPLWAADPSAPTGFTANQNYRIALQVDPSQNLVMFWGTITQLPDVSAIDSDTPNTILINFSAIGRNPIASLNPKERFAWRYLLTTADRGFSLAVYAMGQESQVVNASSGLENSKVICIQRPTNTVNGSIKATPKAPVFVIFSDLIPANDIQSWTEGIENGLVPGFRFGTVRDDETPFSDNLGPDDDPLAGGVRMNVQSANILYTFDYEWNQPPMLDNFNHVIKFAFGLGTIRHIYLEEMDLLGLVYGGSFSPEQTATIDLYSPIQTRTYTAGPGHAGAQATFIKTVVGTGPTNKFKDTDIWARTVLLSDGTAVTDLNIH